jgi:predicted RNA-binding Zn-ribbon protein involved in translation (DUF1610 family)
MLAGHNDASVHIKQQKITMQKNSVPVLAALITTEVEVKCPSCGKTDVARPASDKRTTASVVGGFIVKLPPHSSIQIICSNCRVTVYQVEEAATPRRSG